MALTYKRTNSPRLNSLTTAIAVSLVQRSTEDIVRLISEGMINRSEVVRHGVRDDHYRSITIEQ